MEALFRGFFALLDRGRVWIVGHGGWQVNIKVSDLCIGARVLVQFVLGFLGARFAAINGSGLLGIGFSVVVVIVAALNLILDFDFIESGVQAGAPKYMEWYGAFGLIVTLIWLYLEILRLLAKFSSRK